MKKIICLLLALLLLPMAVACQNSPEIPEKTDNESTVEGEPSAVIEETTAPLPDYGGRDFTVAVAIDSALDIAAEDSNGSRTENAMYARNKKIESDYHVNIKYNIVSNDSYTWYTTLSNLLSSGDNTYDLAGHYAYLVYIPISKGLFLNWNDVEGLNLDDAWWGKSINDSATFNGKLFGLSGYIGMSMMQYAEAMFVNSRYANQYNINENDLYALVDDGKWTFEVFSGLTKDIYVDLNNNNRKDDGDLFGYANATGAGFDLWQTAFDIPVTGRNDQGNLIELVMNEKRIKAIEVLCNFFHNNVGTRVLTADASQTSWTWYEQYNFSKERQVFMAGLFRAAFELLRNMDDGYSVVPVPKWDEAQSEYLTHLNDRYTVWGIPLNVTDTEFVGTITNALAKESFIKVYPEFYDVAMKSKFSKNADCARMIDLVMSGVRFDVAYMLGEYVAKAPYMFRDLVKANSTNLSSVYKTSKKMMESKMAELIGFYKD